MTRPRQHTQAFSDAEVGQLLEAASRAEAWLLNDRDGRSRFRITGIERRLLYSLAVESGLRLRDLRSLRTTAFDLDAEVPTVLIETGTRGGLVKERRALTVATAQALAELLRLIAPGGKVFRLPPTSMLDAALNADLSAAGLHLGAANGVTVNLSTLVRAFERRQKEWVRCPLFRPHGLTSVPVE